VMVGKGVYLPVHLHAFLDVRRQLGYLFVADKISEEIADHEVLIIARKV
jgi:hypothetical protein